MKTAKQSTSTTPYSYGRPIHNRDIGLKILCNPQEANIDIVAIHGIGAHPDDTWCTSAASKGADPGYVNWLSDPRMLPLAVPTARIMRYGYKSRWFGGETIRQDVTTVADRLLVALSLKRDDYENRPLLFIAHGFGGLVVLRALLKDKHFMESKIYQTTVGLVFFGTPFRGADLTQTELIQAAQDEYEDVDSRILRITEPNDEVLLQLVQDFMTVRARSKMAAELVCFYEQVPCDVMALLGKEGKKAIRVGESSGCLDGAQRYSMPRTHFDINKFSDPEEEDYELVKSEILRIVKKAPSLLASGSQSMLGYRTLAQSSSDKNSDIQTKAGSGNACRVIGLRAEVKQLQGSPLNLLELANGFSVPAIPTNTS
ncbi:hypothetical protein DRE_01284 [Drechslerella stenobrocha 248]|uniref:DUF676 domain-containing protein n=1 Tax=Drechslerella stenobrocha 248 TaxID=1043628 RepID=W7HV42_9PEZI|nr:hypothetical protein DRE_01284 [Drechslerella stenobrocha 248]